MYFIGIDNGCNGAISVIDDKLNIIKVMKYPRCNLLSMRDFLLPYRQTANKTCFAALERPFLSYNKHKGNEITYEVFGTHKMNLECLKIPYELAEPRIKMKNCWRKEFNFISTQTADIKLESIRMCNLIFDGKSDKYLRQQKRNIKNREELTNPDDNIAEALLLAVYAQRVYKGAYPQLPKEKKGGEWE